MISVNKPKIIVIVGPNASGKSGLAIKLAKKFNGEIISADSRQVYRGMDIGTGKVSKKEQRLIKHYLLGVVSPKKVFSASDFKKLGSRAINKILKLNKTPIIVGGTGFYIDALLKDLSLPEVPPNKKLRRELEQKSAKDLFKMLMSLDSDRAQTIDSKNKRRLIRALEIVRTTGRIVPHLKERSKYEILYIGITKPKNILEKRIKLRLYKRLEQGMVKEVKNLLNSEVSRKRLYDFGLEYRWIGEYLAGKINYVEMRKGLYKAIVKYSKRQITWFKRNKEIHWIKSWKEAEKLTGRFLF